MEYLVAVAVILVLALGLLWSGYWMCSRAAAATEELLELQLEIHKKAADQLRFELTEFKKGVTRYVESRDERDRIRAIGDLGTRMERVLQLFPDAKHSPAVPDPAAPGPAPGVDDGRQVG